MTSPYASTTEVVDAIATTAINDNPPSAQLTAVAGDAEEQPNAQIESAINGCGLQQDRRGKIDNVGEDEAPGPVPKNETQDDAEEQKSSPSGQADATGMASINTDMNSMEDGNLGELDNADSNKIEARQHEGQSTPENDQSPQQPQQDLNGQPDSQSPAHTFTQEGQQVEFYNHDASGGQGIIANAQQELGLGQQPLGFYDGLALDEAQALLSFQMMQQLGQQPYLAPSPVLEAEGTRIQAYAKIEFPDGEFYMNTFSIVLGRDIPASRAALRRDKEEEKRRIEQVAKHDSDTPVRIKREESRYSKSIVSETGGILIEGDDSDSDQFTKKRKSRKASKRSKSTGSSSQHASRRNSVAQPDGLITYQPQIQSRHLRPETDGAAPVDSNALRPSPHECPLIGIHPPASASASAYKAISRKHVKIFHNAEKHLFQAQILGRNGAFIDEDFCHFNEVRDLKSGSELQIGTVLIRFVLPEVAIGQTGAEQLEDYEDNMIADRYSEGGKEMSFDFESGPREGVNLDDSSEESSEDEERVQIGDPEGDDEQGEESDEEAGEELDDEEEGEEEEEEEENAQNGDPSSLLDEGDEEEKVEESIEKHDLPKPTPKGEKKRGPGRPPKDGIMSKRQQREAKKEAEALAQQKQNAKKAPQQSTNSTSITGKNKVGRPRKHPRPDTPPVAKEKRKYTKRKPKEPKDPDVKQEGEGDDDASKDKKEKKPVKPARSPSPEFNEAELTPEQLAKPQANYVTLIHEAISNSASGQMSLPQIYRAIQRRYPYFKLRCQTNGWQSSVRHNLSQHHAFQKGDKDGKGYLWSVVNGVSIEKEKKRRVTPPPGQPHMHQPIYQAGYPPHMMPGYPGMMALPPGYSHMPPNGQFMQHPQFMGQPPLNGLPPHPGHPPQMNGPYPPPYPLSVPPQLTPQSGATYSSPYAPKPPVSAPPQSNEQRPSEIQPQPQVAAPTAQPSPAPKEEAQPAPQTPRSEAVRPDENTRKFLEVIQPAMLKMLTDWKSDKPQKIWDSVKNRILGITTASTVNDDDHEKTLMDIIKKQLTPLSAISGVNNKLSNPASVSSQQNNQQSPESQPPTNQVVTQGNATAQPVKSIGSERLPTQVMRPSFTGRVNGASLPRPPMKTPGMQRTKSGSPANASLRQSVPPSSASPAATSSADASPAAASQPASSTNGASAPKLTPNGIDRLTEQKQRSLEDAQDFCEPKRLKEDGHFSGLKRSLEDADDNRDFKRHSAAGPPQLKA